jgi:hypothetical protein
VDGSRGLRHASRLITHVTQTMRDRDRVNDAESSIAAVVVAANSDRHYSSSALAPTDLSCAFLTFHPLCA